MPSPRNMIFAGCAAVATALATSPTVAQDFSLPTIDVLSPQLNAIEFGRQNEQAADAARGDNSYPGEVPTVGENLASALAGSAPTVGSTQSLDTRYRYDRSRTRANFRRFVERTPSGAGRADLEQMLAAQPTIIDDIRGGIAPYGLDTHDVADAYAMWWINAWLAYEKLDQDTDRGTVAMVKRQVRDAFAATPDFAKTTDAQRQEYAEALLIQGLMLAAGIDQLKGQPQMMEQLSRAALQGAKASGLDLSKMTLTPNGFMPREGADASDAESGDAQLASEDAAKDSTALALAAGAGLGVVLLGGAIMMRRKG